MALYTEVHGEGNGETVLLSSGLGGSAGYWSLQIPALVGAGYRVVAYDQRGTGRSLAPLPVEYFIQDMAADVEEVMNATDTERCHFVGHALGALVGLQGALDFGARIQSLILINAWAQPNPHSSRCFEARLKLLDAVGPRAYVEAQPIFLYPASWCAANAERVQAEVDHAFEHFPGAETMHARIAALRRFDVAQRLAQIEVPVLISAAQDDVLVPWTCSERLAKGLKQAVWDCVPHGGHAHNVTGAPGFNRSLLAFLQNVTGAERAG